MKNGVNVLVKFNLKMTLTIHNQQETHVVPTISRTSEKKSKSKREEGDDKRSRRRRNEKKPEPEPESQDLSDEWTQSSDALSSSPPSRRHRHGNRRRDQERVTLSH